VPSSGGLTLLTFQDSNLPLQAGFGLLGLQELSFDLGEFPNKSLATDFQGGQGRVLDGRMHRNTP
jgi:hypothetical protein